MWRLLRRGEHGGVLDGVEKFAAEVVHACAELAQAGGELVVADDGGDGDDEAGGGGDEGFGDAGGYGAQGGCACGAEAVEGVDDAQTVPKRPMKGAMAAMVASQVMWLSMAVRASLDAVWAARSRRYGIAREAASAVLALVLVVDLVEDGDEGAGLELVGDGGDFAQAAGFAEGAEEALALHVGFAEAHHLENMMAQEKMLAMSRRTSTVKATGPLL